METFRKAVLTLFAAALACSALAVRMPVIFQSGMVLQRDKEVPVWGFGEPGERVTATFQGISRDAVTGADGRWMVRFPARPAGGPFTLTVRGASETLVLDNILTGDVWICGGQSNMQFTLDDIKYAPEDTAAIARTDIRLFSVPIVADYVPREDLSGGRWTKASAATIRSFSAAGWFFGKFLHDSLHVPIGLISDNLFATALETWMSPEGLRRFPQFGPFCKTYLDPGLSVGEMTAAFEKIRPEWEAKYYLTGRGMKERWYLPETDITSWGTMEIPNWWEESGLPGFDGAVWFRKEFDLPAGFTGDSLPLVLNQIDDYDIVWVNGQKIGEDYGNQTWRNYKVPAGILKASGNTIVVRVFDAGGKGGMYTNAIWGNGILVGKWLFKADDPIDPATFPRPLVPNISPFSTPAVLYNGNIAPIAGLAVKGFIWYQGESNLSRAAEYRELFPAFIADWRARFGQGDVPFLFVQLANYMPEVPEPGESRWAELREAQAAALRLKNTGMAVAIDIGEAYNIHPSNKMEAGRRLGLAALKVAYGRDVVCTGPEFRSAEVRGDRVVLHFDKGTGPLITKDKYGYVRGFAVAGADRKFRWAKAFIDGDDVVVSSDMVGDPVAVRYAWSDNPGPVDLYNASGLPAAPFRTDDWPLSTQGSVFSENPWENL